MAELDPIDLGGLMHRLLGTVFSSAESGREAEHTRLTPSVLL